MPAPAGARVALKVNGQALPDDIAGLVVSAMFEQCRNLPDACVLVFRDNQHMVFDKVGATIGATIEAGISATDTADPVKIFKGEVTALEIEMSDGEVHSVIRGYDQSHRLNVARHADGFVNATFGDMVRKVATRAGLSVGDVDSSGGPLDVTGQFNRTDTEFLDWVERRSGNEYTVQDGKLVWRQRPKPSDSPIATLRGGQDVRRLRAGVVASGQVSKVTVTSWDMKNKQKISSEATPQAGVAAVGDTTPTSAAGKLGGPEHLVTSPVYGTKSQTDAAAKAVANDIASGMVQVEGVTDGRPDLAAGKIIELTELGPTFNGKYVLTAVRHQLDAVGTYTTAFTVSGSRDASLFGLTQGQPGGREVGLVPAVVTNNNDPENMGRVKLSFPWMSDSYESDWARCSAPGAGNKRGLVAVPEVNDEVLVGFEHGDMNRPYVLGGLFNGKDAPPDAANLAPNKSVDERIWMSRTGHKITMVDKQGAEQITIQTGDGNYVLTLDQNGKQLVITADQKITVSGQDIEITAKKGLKLTGNEVTITGQQKLSASAPQTQVEGQSKLDLTSTGQTTIKGTAGVAIN